MTPPTTHPAMVPASDEEEEEDAAAAVGEGCAVVEMVDVNADGVEARAVDDVTREEVVQEGSFEGHARFSF